MMKPQTTADSDRSKAGTADNGPWLIRGTVLRPDGQPAAGAEILALRWYWSNRVSWRPMATARTGAKGKFEVRVIRPGYDGLGSGLMALAARVDGFAIEWRVGRQSPTARNEVPRSFCGSFPSRSSMAACSTWKGGQ